MKITRRQLRQILKEELIRLAEIQVGDDDDPSTLDADDLRATAIELETLDAGTGKMMTTVRDAILELFVMNGDVGTGDVFDHLRMNGFDDASIDAGLELLEREY